MNGRGGLDEMSLRGVYEHTRRRGSLGNIGTMYHGIEISERKQMRSYSG